MGVQVARQPIFNQKQERVAYELLFREGDSVAGFAIDGDAKTSAVISNSHFSVGLDQLLGGKPGFINFTRNLLVEQFPLLLPKELLVVELLEDIEPDDDLIEACKALQKAGYTLALDDFVFSDELLPLVEMAKIIKFDFLISTPEEISHYLSQLPENPDRTLLAEKVETQAQFEMALDMGFELFQGYFFSHPEIVTGAEVPDASLKLLEVVAEVNQPEFDSDRLVGLIEPDVSLTYKLLRYINSAYYGLKTPMSSINQAITYLGQSEIRRFISMVALADLSQGKPDEIARNACTRAKFCELLVASSAALNVDEREAFTTGLLSLIDAIMCKPMEELIPALPLSDGIKAALAYDVGGLSQVLKVAVAYERGRWSEVNTLCEQLGIEETPLAKMYVESCRWSNSVT